jgi:anti-sigma regulatory factor (Ser/Thr protein kinase)
MSRYRHEALLYAGEDELLATTVPFVQDAIAAGAPALVALPGTRLQALESHVDGDADMVTWVDMEEIGRNPACIISAWHDFVTAHEGAADLRGIGEPIFAARSAAEIDECQRHEALLNVAIPDHVPLWLLCPYNTAELSADVISAAHRTHPTLRGPTGVAHSQAYDEVALREGVFADAAVAPAPDAVRFDIHDNELASLRRSACDTAERLGLAEWQLADLALVVSELVSNTIRHGNGHGSLHLWRTDHTVVCQVRDAGHVADLLVGRLRPHPERRDGRGLWIANQLCDLVQIRSREGSTVVTAHLHIRPG